MARINGSGDGSGQLRRDLYAAIAADVARVGFRFKTLDDLRQSGMKYVPAIPVLLKWLTQVTDYQVKEAIVRALSFPWAKGLIGSALIHEYFLAQKTADMYRWAIGNAIEIAGDSSIVERVLEIVTDSSNGKSREMFVLALAKLKHPKRTDVLLELLGDDQVVGHAVIALGRLRESRAVPRLESLLSHQKEWIRKEAIRALRRINEHT